MELFRWARKAGHGEAKCTPVGEEPLQSHGGRHGTVLPDPERSAQEGARARGEVRGAEAKESWSFPLVSRSEPWLHLRITGAL